MRKNIPKINPHIILIEMSSLHNPDLSTPLLHLLGLDKPIIPKKIKMNDIFVTNRKEILSDTSKITKKKKKKQPVDTLKITRKKKY